MNQRQVKEITRTRKERVMIRTEGKVKEGKILGKKFKGKVAALKKQHKKYMKEMTELATVISGAKQAPPRAY